MFTGIIQAVGVINSRVKQGGDVRLTIDTQDLEIASTALGDSIAVNGVCLTAVELQAHGFCADVSVETLNKTSLSSLQAGSHVNLEKALTLQTALGGHLVSGHVDGLGTVIDITADARSIRYQFEVPVELQHYIAIKGSVTVDGTSLTVNQVSDNRFDVNIVPHTQQQTIFGYYSTGTKVNIEVDLIARYLERLIQGKHESIKSGDAEWQKLLQTSGFMK